MKRFIGIFALMAVTAMAISSCAKQETEDFTAVRDLAFDYWMERNHPDLVKNEDGIYVDVIYESESGDTPELTNWVEINFTGYLINDAVYATRYEEMTEKIGTFAYTTHFVPQFTYMSDYVLPVGILDALLNMKTGDRSVLYIPPSLAYTDVSSTFNTGYAGTSSIYSNAPIILDVELMTVTEDAIEREQEFVTEYALENWGMTEADTLQEYFYVQEISSVYGSDTITADSTVFLYYKGTFLDGFVFDTNIEEEAIAANRYNYYNDYTPMEYDISEEELIQAFYDVLTNDDVPKKYNDKFKMLFTSQYSYGETGDATGSTIIQSYDPLIFEVQIMPYMGFEENPYTVEYILNKISDTDADPKEDIYVFGYVVGCVNGDVLDTTTAELEEYEDNFTSRTSLLIATTTSETDINNMLVIDLTSNEYLQEYYNLVDYPARYQSTMIFKGDIATVFGVTGITNIESTDD
ncbi:MAG: DUF6359 domain-containing protein [Rikenellaceae bacterium]